MKIVSFEATIRMTDEELQEADGDIAQAVQNAVGHTGASVEDAELLGEDAS